MRKIILLFLSCVILFSVVGCKEKNNNSNFENIYSIYSDETNSWGWMTISSDKKTLTLDSKPVDDLLEVSADDKVTKVIYAVHAEFDIPSYVISQIGETTKADGTKYFENDSILVWWKYSSVKGLEISYQLK